MVSVIAKFPGISFEAARIRTNDLLDQAGGKRNYRLPPVLTDEEQQARRDSVRARFSGRSECKAR
jgi:hypothetical protein